MPSHVCELLRQSMPSLHLHSKECVKSQGFQAYRIAMLKRQTLLLILEASARYRLREVTDFYACLSREPMPLLDTSAWNARSFSPGRLSSLIRDGPNYRARPLTSDRPERGGALGPPLEELL